MNVLTAPAGAVTLAGDAVMADLLSVRSAASPCCAERSARRRPHRRSPHCRSLDERGRGARWYSGSTGQEKSRAADGRDARGDGVASWSQRNAGKDRSLHVWKGLRGLSNNAVPVPAMQRILDGWCVYRCRLVLSNGVPHTADRHGGIATLSSTEEAQSAAEAEESCSSTGGPGLSQALRLRACY